MSKKKQEERTLTDLEKNRQAVSGLKAEILRLDADMVHETELGYGWSDEETRVNSPRMKELIDRKRALEAELAAVSAHVAQADAALLAMCTTHTLVLKEFFCEGRYRGAAVVKLQRQLNVSEATVYRIKRRALEEFAHRMGYIEKLPLQENPAGGED